MRPLERCEICGGDGKIRGVFHVMECAACNGGGLVDAETHAALPYRELVEQLRLRVDQLAKQRNMQQAALMEAGLWPLKGPANDYVGQNNKHHRGGGNWTGD